MKGFTLLSVQDFFFLNINVGSRLCLSLKCWRHCEIKSDTAGSSNLCGFHALGAPSVTYLSEGKFLDKQTTINYLL